jgi:hypothetical protein
MIMWRRLIEADVGEYIWSRAACAKTLVLLAPQALQGQDLNCFRGRESLSFSKYLLLRSGSFFRVLLVTDNEQQGK